MALIKVEFQTVNEAGAAGAAQRVRRELLSLRDGASSTAGTLTERLGTAFQRLERREPTLVMRQLRGAVDDMAASAIGASGPVGRLAVSLVGLAPGGAITFGAVGGIAGVVFGMKAILAPTTAATDALNKFSEGLKATATPAERLHDLLNQLALGAAKTQSILAGLRAGLVGTFAGAGEVVGGIAEGSLTAASAARVRAIEAEAAARARAGAKAITDLEIQTALLGQDATARARVQAAQLGLNEADTAALVLSAQKHERRVQEIADLEAQRELLQAIAAIQGGINLPALQAEIAGIGKLPLITKPDINIASRVDFSKTPQLTKDLGDALKKLEVGLDSSGDAAARAALAHQLAAVRIISAAVGLIAGLASGGSPGGFLAGLGGLVGLIPGLQIAGAIVGGLGSILLASESNEERRHGELLAALEPVGETLFLLANTNDPDSLDSFARRAEQVTGRRVTVRFGGR